MKGSNPRETVTFEHGGTLIHYIDSRTNTINVTKILRNSNQIIVSLFYYIGTYLNFEGEKIHMNQFKGQIKNR